MRDQGKTKEQLTTELKEMRKRVAELETAEAERKKAEEALRESEEKYKQLYENAPVMLHTLNKKGVLLDCNKAFQETIGYRKEEMIGKPVYDFETEESRKLAPQALEKVAREGTIHGERDFMTKDGNLVTLEFSAYIEYDEKQNEIIIKSASKDITERKEAEEALRQSEENYKNVFELAPDGITTVNTKGLVTSCNRAFSQLTGFSKEEIVGKHFSKIPSANVKDIPKYFKIFASVMKGSKPKAMELALTQKDGTKRLCEFQASLMKKGGKITGLQAIARDVTERRKAEEKLQESEEKFSKAFRSSPAAMMISSFPGGRIIDINDVYTSVLGYHREELIDHTVIDKKIWEKPEARDEVMKTLKEHRVIESMEFGLRTKSGEIREMLTSMCLIDLEGAPYIISASVDITERKRAENELIQSEERNRLLLESAGEAIYGQDNDGNCTFANPAFLRMLGYDREEDVLGKNMHELMHYKRPDGTPYPKEECKIYQASKMGEGMHVDDEVLWRADGTSFPVEYWSHPINKEGEVIGAVMVFTDIAERKQAEDTLRKSEKQASAAIEAARAFTFSYDIATGKVEWSGAIEEITGYTREEFAKVDINGWTERIHPDDRDEILSILQGAMGKDRATAEYRFKTKKGYITLSSISLTEKQDGKAIRLVGILQDITERKRAEEELRASEEKYKALVENANDFIYMIDNNNKILSVNAAGARLLHQNAEEIVGKTVYDLFPKEVAGRFSKNLKRVFETGEFSTEESESVRDGEKTWISTSLSPIKNPANEVVAVMGVTRDITGLKRAEEELRASEELLRLMFESVTDGITVTNLNGVIINANNRTAEMHGFDSRESIMGKSAFEFIAPHEQERALENAQKTLEMGSVEGIEYSLLRADGSEFPGELSASVMRDASGAPVGLIAITRDITERKRAEERERQLQKELILSSRLATTGEMASGIAHEINNPLTGVIGFAGLLLKKDIPEDIRQDVNIIYEGAQRVANVTGRMLTFARQHKPERVPVDINEIIETTLTMRSYAMKSNNIKVSSQLAPTLPHTIADGGQLQQVFLNIILNAETEMTASHHGGNLTVKTEQIDNTIRVCFTDDGPGIHRKYLERIFDPFFTTRGVGEGTGLGLSVCHGIISQHSGKIYAESRPGKGATFFVELPIVTEAEGLKITEPAAGEPQKISKSRILVVDDDTIVQKFLTEALSDEGHEVEVIDNGDDALDKLESEDYDVILLDIKLPGMNGIELYKHMQRIAKPLAMRVVFITGDIMSKDTTAFLSKTKASYITKPFDIEQLKKYIKHIISEYS